MEHNPNEQQAQQNQQMTQTPPVNQQPCQQNASNPMAIGALVCGIVSVVFCWFSWFSFVSLALSIISIVLGTKGMKIAKATNSGKGLAIAGLVCGIVGAALSAIAVITYIWLISAVSSFLW